jgi:hypothetical protein
MNLFLEYANSQFRFSDKRADIQMWSYLSCRVKIQNQSAEKWRVTRLAERTVGVKVGGSQVDRGRNDVLVNTSTLAWTYTGDVRVIRRNTKGEDALDIRPTLAFKWITWKNGLIFIFTTELGRVLSTGSLVPTNWSRCARSFFLSDCLSLNLSSSQGAYLFATLFRAKLFSSVNKYRGPLHKNPIVVFTFPRLWSLCRDAISTILLWKGKKRPIQMSAYVQCPSLIAAVIMIITAAAFGILASFKFGRTLLEKVSGLSEGKFNV